MTTMKNDTPKERPILFNAPMVRAILADRKTQTRRVVKLPAHIRHDELRLTRMQDGYPEGIRPVFGDDDEPNGFSVRNLYGQPGDRLWVRETTCIAPRHFAPPDDTCLTDYDGFARYVSYRADGHSEDAMRDYKLKWTPAIHVPKWASRITLEVVSVRVERLQEITAADALAEGIATVRDEWSGACQDFDESLTDRQLYKILWESINGEGSWDANPWVWVVEFKRVEGRAGQ